MTSSDAVAVRSIVLIDDDQDFLHMMQRRLQAQRQEYAPGGTVEIRAFTDPVEALVNMPASGICVVFLDYNLQDSTGLDWLPQIIKVGMGPVILLTNQNDVKIAAEAFRGGVADYIAKPDVVTDDNRLGRAIREAVHRFRLEQRNASLTRQLKLVNMELEAKNNRLRSLTETAHQFVDDVAHDFRTPLTVIQQYASIVADGLSGPTTEAQRDHMAIITEASEDLAKMVDDFLDSSKLRARSLCVDRQSHTIQELWDAVGPILDMRSSAKQVAVQYSAATDMPAFFADLPMVVRILTNLAINAIKVTPAGKALQLWAQPDVEGGVSIGVTDQGPGLSKDDLKVIFERFRQLVDAQSNNTKGFGLGLSIVKHLTLLNLGTVQVQSTPGNGSTFAFTLPSCERRNILSQYIESARHVEGAESLWMLHIRPSQDARNLAPLRQLVSSCSYPMDVVFEDAESGSIKALGVCNDASAWSARLSGAVAQMSQGAGRALAELEWRAEGPWRLADDKTALVEKLLESFSRRTIHV